MKIKQQPEDFQVEELTDFTPTDRGAFAFYRMEKTGWSTPDALAAVRRRWKIDLRRLSYGGLKDRHARTVQYLTIHHGPRRHLHHQNIAVTYLGQVSTPYTSRDLKANKFTLTLRAIPGDSIPAIEKGLDEVRRDGYPNYFDDQRFGSVDCGGQFIGKLLVLGQFEAALKQALAGPYEFDRAAQKKEKAILLAHWGDWSLLKQKLPRGHARSLVDYLTHHPDHFKGAVARLRPELRGLYLSAYQSDLWNRMLAHWLRHNVPAESLVDISLKRGPMPFHRNLDNNLKELLNRLKLPLPTARLKMTAEDPAWPYINQVLREENLALADLKVRGLRDLFFSRGDREAICNPENLTYAVGLDTCNAGKNAVQLSFELPRGSYATLLVKRVAIE